MATRLKIDLYPTWSDRSAEHPNALATYIRDASSSPGTLQVSRATYAKPGPPPKLTDDGLLQMATRLATTSGGNVTDWKNGSSPWGRFGSVVASNARQRTQVWIINNGPENVLVTHIGPLSPDPVELKEVEAIVNSIRVTEGG